MKNQPTPEQIGFLEKQLAEAEINLKKYEEQSSKNKTARASGAVALIIGILGFVFLYDLWPLWAFIALIGLLTWVTALSKSSNLTKQITTTQDQIVKLRQQLAEMRAVKPVTSSSIDRIQQLTELLSMGGITQEEYDKKRSQILSEL